jgi:hypothetical protein
MEAAGTYKLNRNQLKYLVIIAMLIDHIAWAFVPTASPLGQVMHFVGRLTGPTMAYLLAEGYMYTRSRSRYLTRLGVFALISWVPFSFFETGTFPSWNMGVMYTLFLGILSMWIFDTQKLSLPVKYILIGLIFFASAIGDWAYFDIIWPLGIHRLWNRPDQKWKWFGMTLLLAVFAFFYGAQPVSAALFNLGILLVYPLLRYGYSGKPGRKSAFHKWFFYIFYPLHLLIIYLISLL